MRSVLAATVVVCLGVFSGIYWQGDDGPDAPAKWEEAPIVQPLSESGRIRPMPRPVRSHPFQWEDDPAPVYKDYARDYHCDDYRPPEIHLRPYVAPREAFPRYERPTMQDYQRQWDEANRQDQLDRIERMLKQQESERTRRDLQW